MVKDGFELFLVIDGEVVRGQRESSFSLTCEIIDVTNDTSPDYVKEYLPGLLSGSVSVSFAYNSDLINIGDSVLLHWGENDGLQSKGIISSLTISAENNSLAMCSAEITLSENTYESVLSLWVLEYGYWEDRFEWDDPRLWDDGTALSE